MSEIKKNPGRMAGKAQDKARSASLHKNINARPASGSRVNSSRGGSVSSAGNRNRPPMDRPPMGDGHRGGRPPMDRPPMDRPPRRRRTSSRTSLGGILFAIIVIGLIMLFLYISKSFTASTDAYEKDQVQAKTETGISSNLETVQVTADSQEPSQEETQQESATAARETETSDGAASEKIENTTSADTSAEAFIYSYLQGVKSYERGLEWTGDWCYIEAGGQQFSAFGCGLCCMANVYSTIKGEAMTPSQMYDYTKANTGYDPDSGVGAVSWDQMQSVFNSLGISSTLATKPADYASFQQMAADNESLLVLVSGGSDGTLWKNIPGHYVNIWMYNSETDQVFLTDSKGPTNNRQYVALRDVYDALKTSSNYQILEIPQQ